MFEADNFMSPYVCVVYVYSSFRESISYRTMSFISVHWMDMVSSQRHAVLCSKSLTFNTTVLVSVFVHHLQLTRYTTINQL